MTLPKKSGSLLGTAGGTQAIEEGLWPMESQGDNRAKCGIAGM